MAVCARAFLAATLLLAGAGCAPEPGVPVPVPAPTVVPRPSEPEDAAGALRQWLALQVVYAEEPARRVFYTWTTEAQIAELRRSRVLLTRSEAPDRPSLFQQEVQKVTYTTLARLLVEPGFARRRFAWTNPWATVRGWNNESYGNRLVRVSLKENAVIARFVDGAHRGFVGLDGAVVFDQELFKNPDRLAAVFHVHGAHDGVEAPFREFVLCNEAAIEEWEVDTPEIAARARLDATMLVRLRDAMARGGFDEAAGDQRSWRRVVADTLWNAAVPRPSLEQLYAANLAFLNDRYVPDRGRIDEIVRALSALPAGVPLRHRPGVTFLRAPPPPPPPRPPPEPPRRHPPKPCVRQGTMGCQ